MGVGQAFVGRVAVLGCVVAKSDFSRTIAYNKAATIHQRLYAYQRFRDSSVLLCVTSGAFVAGSVLFY